MLSSTLVSVWQYITGLYAFLHQPSMRIIYCVW